MLAPDVHHHAMNTDTPDHMPLTYLETCMPAYLLLGSPRRDPLLLQTWPPESREPADNANISHDHIRPYPEMMSTAQPRECLAAEEA